MHFFAAFEWFVCECIVEAERGVSKVHQCIKRTRDLDFYSETEQMNTTLKTSKKYTYYFSEYLYTIFPYWNSYISLFFGNKS